MPECNPNRPSASNYKYSMKYDMILIMYLCMQLEIQHEIWHVFNQNCMLSFLIRRHADAAIANWNIAWLLWRLAHWIRYQVTWNIVELWIGVIGLFCCVYACLIRRGLYFYQVYRVLRKHQCFMYQYTWYIDGSVQDCSNSVANALELLQSCAKPSICRGHNRGGGK